MKKKARFWQGVRTALIVALVLFLVVYKLGLWPRQAKDPGRNGDTSQSESVSPADSGETGQEGEAEQPEAGGDEEVTVTYQEAYTTPDEVGAYIYLFGELPPNYITKAAAQKLGWQSSKGNLWAVAPGKCIGGDTFSNYEKVVPAADGRKWYEADVNYEGGYRGAERLLYSSDGLVYYTADHYETATLLYGEE